MTTAPSTRTDEAPQTHAYFDDTYLTEADATVTIEGVNAEPCGGTHVRTLADLAGVRILEVKVRRGAITVRYEAEHADAAGGDRA